MKLGIVIPLKSKLVSRDWLAVSRCLEATLRSLDRQSSNEWVAAVVGHEKPDISWHEFSSRIIWLTATHHVPPIKAQGTFFKFSDYDRINDKNQKTYAGMLHLCDHEVTYWYVLDADDLLHVDFVKTLKDLPVQAGWLIPNGYLWYEDIRRWMPTNRLISLCGSTTIIHSSLFEISPAPHEGDVLSIPWLRLSHSDMQAFLQPRLGTASPIFPLPAVAYTLSHGDNCSDEFRTSPTSKIKVWVKKRFLTRRVNKRFENMFGLRSVKS